MKYQIDVLIRSLIKILLWLVILLVLMGYSFYHLYVSQDLIPISIDNFYSLLGYIPLKYIRYISFYNIYQIILTILFLYIFYNYEKNNSFEFVISRSSNKTILINKLIVSLIFILFVRFMYMLAMYLFFNMFISIDTINLVMGIVLYIVIDIIYVVYKFIRCCLYL